MRAIRSRVRTFASAGLLVSAALLATACQPSDAADSGSGKSSSSAPAAPGKAGGSKATNGTFVGALTYVAPGKYSVKNKMFYVAEDTQILGAGTICGSAQGQSTTKCTFDQLDKAVKKGGVTAEVKVTKGIADRIVEDPSAGSSGGTGGSSNGSSGGSSNGGGSKGSTGGTSNGGSSNGGTSNGGSSNGGTSNGGASNGGSSNGKATNGTFSGALTYLAPGKYIVQNKAFFVADDTEIVGAGTICGDPEGQTSNDCTFDQLDAAVKKGGVHADVTVVKGIATRIAEQP
ncbi:hypothetical protein ABZU86_18145 [Streptomyces sp. NPDC005271]|uniref:hypothetical protein n=1 Tax=unclassified Streptomyces TaxID=2593676 RepID=UPI0033AAD269